MLMNIIGNSLKFTSVCLTHLRLLLAQLMGYAQHGTIQVVLREVHHPDKSDNSQSKVTVELGVVDTGKVK